MTATAAPAMIAATPIPEALMARRAQLNVHNAIDLYLGELARRGKTPATRDKYRRILDPFGDRNSHKTVTEIGADDVRNYLDRWSDKSPSTLALHVSVLKGFFEFCRDEGIVAVSPAERIKRPRRKRPEDLDVVTLSTDDVRRLFAACDGWQEQLCIAVLFYMGVRKTAAANARRRDVDLTAGLMRFREKGGKMITKPIPDELLLLLRQADELGQWLHGDEWLIPNRKPFLVKSAKRRASKVIYETVVKVADRAGIRATPHAIRGAFAVQYDEQHPDRPHDLKELLGHARLETTMTYLRRKNKAAAMESVRDLTLFPSRAVVPPAGFEPALQAEPHGDRHSTETGGASLPDALLVEACRKAKSQEPSGRVTGERSQP